MTTTYLTKTENGKTHHYRVTIESDGIEIVEGIFYNWLHRSFVGLDSKADAHAKLEELVNQKKSEGYQETPFKETLENTLEVFDKAKWHFGGDFPEDLDAFQGYIHTGMFLGWLADTGLLSESFIKEFPDELASFKQRKITGPQLFENTYDGVLTLNDISELGNRFALSYFEFENGKYLIDYGETLATELPSMYHVADTWENYEKLKVVLDKRFEEWKRQNNF